MSGTSLDGIDVALVDTDGEFLVTRGPARTYPYDATFRERLAGGLEQAKGLKDRSGRPGDLAALEREITDRHASAVDLFLSETATNRADIALVGFHGQTVLHRPERGLTVQLGDGARLAEALALPVVSDMRAADMAAGGQGAPLAPIYHAALAASLPWNHCQGPVAFVNIGGISNVTYVEKGRPPIAFDSGPGNALIDQWVEREAGIPFDQGGAIAAEGGVIEEIAKRYLTSDFFTRPAPKSLDRFDFPVPDSGAGSLEDVTRTLCAVTAQAILRAAEHLPRMPSLWILCGGGRHHPAIVRDLREGAKPASVMLAEELGLDGDAMEAEAWAYLAVRSMRGLPLTWPTTTGCRAPTPGGILARPFAQPAKARA